MQTTIRRDYAIFPRRVINPDNSDGLPLLLELGISIVGPSVRDSLCGVRLAPGMLIRRMNPRCQMLLDKSGRCRALIMVGETCLQEPHILMMRRYSIDLEECRVGKVRHVVAVIRNDEGDVKRMAPLPLPERPADRDAVSDHARDLAMDWLDTAFPKWRDPAAYW